MSMLFETPGRMRLLDPVDKAIARTKVLLFQPFDMGIWLQFGIILFLTSVSGFGSYVGGYPIAPMQGGKFDPAEYIQQMLESPSTYVALALSLILYVIVSIPLLWLESRGTFMLMRAVVLNRADFNENWSTPHPSYMSLFRFRLALFVIATIINTALVIRVAMTALNLYASGITGLYIYVTATLYPALFLLLSIATFWSIRALVYDFIVPLMYHFDENIGVAWRRFYFIARFNIPPLLLFYVVKFLYGVVLGIIIMVGSLLTCCIGMMPLIHQCLFSPLLVFDRFYGIYVISSMGGAYDIMSETPPPMPPAFSEPGAPAPGPPPETPPPIPPELLE